LTFYCQKKVKCGKTGIRCMKKSPIIRTQPVEKWRKKRSTLASTPFS